MRYLLAFVSLVVAACSSDPGSAGPVIVPDGEDTGAVSDASPDSASPPGDTSPGDASQGSPNVSGSRLELRYHVLRAADGTVVRWSDPTYYDRQFEMNCQFFPAPDGTHRCIPAGAATFYSSGPFADSDCVQPLANHTTCALAPRFATTLDGASCEYSYRVFAIGAEHEGAIYSKGGASCFESTRSAGATYYRVGRELEPNEFVSGEFTMETATP